MKAYSMDLRERVFADCDAGMEVRQVAVKYRVSESWIRRLKQRRRESGEVAPRPAGHAAEPKWLAHRERLEELVREQPDVTLPELRERLGIDISVQTLSRALRALQLTFKKKSCAPRNKIGPMSTNVGLPGKPR
jgi:transposase